MSIVAENLFKNVKPTMKVVEITPDMAAAWLQRNPRNRSFSPSRARKYAEVMAEGLWKTTYDPIRFDDRGILLDGQHRLSAVVESGVTLTALVVTGMDSEVFDVLDSGATRTRADILTVNGVPPRVARAVASAAVLVDGYEKAKNIYYGQPLKKEKIRNFIAQRPALVPSAEYAISFCRKNPPLSDGCGTFLRYYTASLDRNLSDYFFQSLYTGANLAPNDMILYLRDIIYSDRSVIRGMSKATYSKHVAACIKVWNALRQGRVIKYKNNLRVRSDENFPVIK